MAICISQSSAQHLFGLTRLQKQHSHTYAPLSTRGHCGYINRKTQATGGICRGTRTQLYFSKRRVFSKSMILPYSITIWIYSAPCGRHLQCLENRKHSSVTAWIIRVVIKESFVSANDAWQKCEINCRESSYSWHCYTFLLFSFLCCTNEFHKHSLAECALECILHWPTAKTLCKTYYTSTKLSSRLTVFSHRLALKIKEMWKETVNNDIFSVTVPEQLPTLSMLDPTVPHLLQAPQHPKAGALLCQVADE